MYSAGVEQWFKQKMRYAKNKKMLDIHIVIKFSGCNDLSNMNIEIDKCGRFSSFYRYIRHVRKNFHGSDINVFMENRPQHTHEVKGDWGQTLVIYCFTPGF